MIFDQYHTGYCFQSDTDRKTGRKFSTGISLERVSSVILVENHFTGELVLSDFDQSNLRGYTIASADIAFVCGLNFQVGCQNRLRENLDADEALA